GRFLVWLVNALEVPDLDVASVRARAHAEKAVQNIAAGLDQGQSFSLWPAGHVWRDGLERIGPARSAADILRQVPEASVLLVRSRGLWGSSWTWAQLSARPPLLRRMLAGLGWILANLLFFMPRRRADVTREVVERSRLPEPRREVLNPWLEEWYNRDLNGAAEKPTWVPYHRLFGRRTFNFATPAKPAAAPTAPEPIKPETREAVLHLVETRRGRPLTESEQQHDTQLEQLGLDSLDRMELSLQVERQFGFSGDEACTTIGQLFALAEGRVVKKPPKPPPPEWSRPLSDEGPARIEGDTIASAFVNCALRFPRDVIAADDLAGALTFERLLVGALTLSRRLKAVEASNIGVLRPASVACDVALLALYLAGKLPVILNWTTGPANLAHAAKVTNLSHVLTSGAFIDRTGIGVEGTEYLF